MSCFISAAVEVPAYVSGWLALRFLRRRRSICFTLLLEASALFLIQLVPQSEQEGKPRCVRVQIPPPASKLAKGFLIFITVKLFSEHRGVYRYCCKEGVSNHTFIIIYSQ